jgi:hypothetical protein
VNKDLSEIYIKPSIQINEDYCFVSLHKCNGLSYVGNKISYYVWYSSMRDTKWPIESIRADFAANFGPGHFLATVDFEKEYDVETVERAFSKYVD